MDLIDMANSLARRQGQSAVSKLGAGSGLVILSIVSNLLLLTGPLFMLQVYDRVLASQSVPTLVALTALMLGLYAFYGVLEAVRSRMATRYSVMAAARLTRPVFTKVVAANASSRRNLEGDPVRDVDTIRQFLSGAGPLALLDLPWVPIYLVIVFALHPALGWLAVAGAVVVTVLMIANEWSAQGPARDTNLAANARYAQQSDINANAESVLAMGMRGPLLDRWESATDTWLLAQRRTADRATGYSSLTKAFRLLLQSSVLALGAYLAIGGEISAGLMIAASIVTARALSPVEQSVANWRGFVAARQAKARIKTLLSEDAEPERKAALPLPKATLTVSDLAVSPSHDGPPLLGGVSFSLKAGEAMGVLGLSGCGKSSLIRTLIGVWPARAGTVRLDGSELSHFDPDRLGAAIGYLPQTVELFAGTVAQNIARFNPDADFVDVLKAAEAAGVHELIAGLPQGYETPIGNRGAMLSAGQRQRIGLARALFGDPFLIVLDEPNSNLDAAGDAACNAAVAAAKARGAIVIIVAHRPAAIAAVDLLLFLQDGRQAAFGPKDAVLNAITAQPASLDEARKARVK